LLLVPLRGRRLLPDLMPVLCLLELWSTCSLLLDDWRLGLLQLLLLLGLLSPCALLHDRRLR
jgi:hypothetical protein